MQKERKELTSDDLAYGQFIVNFLNCPLNHTSINVLIKECFSLLEIHLKYRNPGWDGLEVASFRELLGSVHPGFLKRYLRPRMQYLAREDRIMVRQSKDWRKKLSKLAAQTTGPNQYMWRSMIDNLNPEFDFYMGFLMTRKRCRRLFVEISKGRTMEDLQNEPCAGELLLRLQQGEYPNCNYRVVLKGNRISLQRVVTEAEPLMFLPDQFFSGYFMVMLEHCLYELSRDEGRDRLSRIRVCPDCGQFFLAKDTKRRNCYSSECKAQRERNYHREDMQERRNPDSKKFDIKYI